MAVANPQHPLVTPKQLEIAALCASGLKIAEIAHAKFLAEITVKQILARARERTGAKTNAQLAAILIQNGQLEPNGGNDFVPVIDERSSE